MKSVVRLTDRPDMTLDVYRGRTCKQQHNYNNNNRFECIKTTYDYSPEEERYTSTDPHSSLS